MRMDNGNIAGKDKEREIVVLIDAENASSRKLPAIMAEIVTYGHIFVKRAYGDWSDQKLTSWKHQLKPLAIDPILQPAYTHGKNSTDIRMVIEAMDLLHSKKFDTFVLVSSDSDFTSLATRLRDEKINVIGVGEKKTPIAFRNACAHFVFTENLLTLEEYTKPDEEQPEEQQWGLPSEETSTSSAELEPELEPGLEPIEYIYKLLDIACKNYGDEEGWTYVASAGSYLKRSLPGFDIKGYNYQRLTHLIRDKSDFYELVDAERNKENPPAYKYRRKEL